MSFANIDATRALFRHPVLQRRMVTLLEALAAHPQGSWPQACRSKAELKAAYRFCNHPETTPQNLWPAFTQPAAQHLADQAEVVAIHDSTSFNFTHLRSAEGLGFLNDSTTARGLHLHSALLLDVRGQLVGLGQLDFWIRAKHRTETAEEVKRLPIEQKESYKWLRGIAAVHDAFAAVTATPPRIIHVMDREGDIHDVFADLRRRQADGVIRCAQNRCVADDEPRGIAYAKKKIARQPCQQIVTLSVRVPGGGDREARMEVRTLSATLVPNVRKHPHRNRLKLQLLELREVSTPPTGTEPVCWRIWTTLRVSTNQQVLRVLRLYRWRWRIEDFHRTLKTGCRVEEFRLQTGGNLMTAITLSALIAARIVSLRDAGKADPEQPCTSSFTLAEWHLLWHRHHGRPWHEGDGVPKLGEALRWLGRLGGHLGRTRDPLPGAECLSHALYALSLLLEGHALGQATTEPPPKRPRHSPKQPPDSRG